MKIKFHPSFHLQRNELSQNFVSSRCSKTAKTHQLFDLRQDPHVVSTIEMLSSLAIRIMKQEIEKFLIPFLTYKLKDNMR